MPHNGRKEVRGVTFEQFRVDVRWGDLDYLLIDMPPGTGDIQMALARLLPAAASEASIIGQLAAFVLCAGFAMWAFAAPSGWRATWTIAVAGSIAAAIAWVLITSGGRL